MLCPLLPGPLMHFALISDTGVQHPNHPPGVSKASWAFPTQTVLLLPLQPSLLCIMDRALDCD